MANTKRCIKCILSESFPRITFDEQGTCNFCNDELFHSTDSEQIEKAKVEIKDLFDAERGKHEYDAVVCYSGGKDSTYTLKLAVEKYKLNVLAFTLDNGFFSQTAKANIEKIVKKLGVDHITYQPSYAFMKSLFRTSSTENIYNPRSLMRISSNCYSCISIVNNTALKISLEKEIPFIISGFTLGQIPCNAIWFKNNYEFLRESRKPILDKLKAHLGNEVSKHMEISDSLIAKSGFYPYNINLLTLEEISEKEILENIISMGWDKPGNIDGCSTNCRINAFNNYIHRKRFGFNPYELEMSHMIRKNLLTREEALDKLYNQPDNQIKYIYSELGMASVS